MPFRKPPYAVNVRGTAVAAEEQAPFQVEVYYNLAFEEEFFVSGAPRNDDPNQPEVVPPSRSRWMPCSFRCWIPRWTTG